MVNESSPTWAEVRAMDDELRRARILGELLSLLYDHEHATGDAQENFDDEAVGIDPPATSREIEDALLWLCEQYPRHNARTEQPHAGGGDGDGER